MRILLLIPRFYPEWGGAENQARMHAQELARRGHDVHVLTWRSVEASPQAELLHGYQVTRVPRGRSRPSRLVAYLAMSFRILVAARRCDAIVAHQLLSTAYLGGWAAALWRRPIAAKAATVLGRGDGELDLLNRRGFRGVVSRLASFPLRRRGIAIAMTAQIETDLRQLGFRHVERIPNGVSPTPPCSGELRRRLRDSLGLESEARLVVSSGRLNSVKGFDVLTRAWPDVAERVPGAVLAIVGDGPETAALKEQVRTLGVEESVTFLGRRQDAAALFGAADLVAIPSRFEGMSNVLLESMAAGTPVVSTAVSGSVDLITDRVNGRLVPPGDADALAVAIVETLRYPGRLGALGRDTVERLCGLETVVGRYEELLLAASLNHTALCEVENKAGLGA